MHFYLTAIPKPSLLDHLVSLVVTKSGGKYKHVQESLIAFIYLQVHANLQVTDAETEVEFSSYVRDHGCFKIFANGRVRIVFCDATIMEFYYPKTPDRSVESIHGKAFGEHDKALDDGVFNLTLPNGVSFKSSFDSFAGPYKRFVN